MLKQVEIDDRVIQNLKTRGLEIVHVGGAVAGDTVLDERGNPYCLQGSYPQATKVIVRPIPPQMVPLGPEDVVPGTVLKHAAWSDWYWQDCRLDCDGKGVCRFCFDHNKFASHYHTFLDLQSGGWSYKTPSMSAFVPCSKPAP